ncbi:amidohydrolase family protein [Pseudodesulfovibrio senegalensis]|uniref:Amidohydrolase family protein n=1 Tax=Pseudodesulfovibrio senegalensis TaxID=1721087 RepID=A0A6N6N7T1_9BACT|nr:amidohydrolase family protein [Pseudodesulfovibrio senegalensis]KAB1443718.1 amidohydrolase family protein [Pseudodesulfovibrio senegalensis]
MRIDVHTHAFHPKIAPRVAEYLLQTHGIAVRGKGTVEELLLRMEVCDLDRAVVHTSATTGAQVIPANNWTISLQADHPQLIAFGSVHPDFDRNEEELNRLERKGIRGLKFHPDFQNVSMDDPRLFELMEMAGDRFIMMFHLGGDLPIEHNPSNPMKMAALRRMFPKPTMIAAHLGGIRRWTEALEHIAGLNIHVDTSSTLQHISGKMFRDFINRHDRQQVLFGSDYPIFDPQEEMALLRDKAKLSEARIEQMLGAATVLFPQSDKVDD